MRREAVAVLAMTAAALSLMAELVSFMPAAPVLAEFLAKWKSVTLVFWGLQLDMLGIDLHRDLIAALNVSSFLILIGIGARLSGHMSARGPAPIDRSRFFDDQTWPSLIILGAVTFIFLLSTGKGGERIPIQIFGNETLGKYGFAILVTAGYFAGDFIGHKEFHIRLYRLAVLVLLLVAVNFAILDGTENPGRSV
jgi:hypothetical protein